MAEWIGAYRRGNHVSLLSDYAAVAPLWSGATDTRPRYDEVFAPDGRPRLPWRNLAAVADSLTTADLERIGAESERMLADDGATHGPFGAQRHSWRLDPIPFIIDSDDWRSLEIGLAQRAELLDAVLHDLYGERRLLRSGVIPAAVVAQHPAHLRELVGAPHAERLTISAIDLARTVDGTWMVLGDRTQAPSGLGYALENRRVLSRLFPAFHREIDAHRSEPFLQVLRGALGRASVTGVDQPRVVLLSPGTHSETSFDQAFLANSLGIPLVQGNDLVSRHGKIWMKPIGWPGAEPVDRIDVILRRLDAPWSDPLELRADSRLGVAGLTDAARRGAVTVVNGLGSGVLESAGVQAFLPAAARAVLGEDLRLATPETWWCGHEDSRREALAALRDDPAGVVVRRADQSRGDIDTRTLSAAALDAVISRIESAPYRYIVRRRVEPSQAPTLAGPGRSTLPEPNLTSQPVTLRTFTVRDDLAHRTFVGGLAAVDGSSPVVTKDVWVLKAEAAEPDQGIDRVVRSSFARTLPVFAPRALDDLFWAGRYGERADSILRMMLTLDSSSRISSADASSTAVEALRRALTASAGQVHDGLGDDLRSLLLDSDRVGGAAHAIAALRDALSGVRDQLSDDTWRIFATTERAAIALRSSPAYPVGEAAGHTLTGLLAFSGVTANMVHDEGWHALQAGLYLERAAQVAYLVRSVLTAPTHPDDEVLAAVLRTCESSVTYRRRYGNAGDTEGAITLLLADHDNPRSIAASVAAVQTHVSQLPLSTGSTRPERLAEALGGRIGDLPYEGGIDELHLGLGSVIDDLHALSDAITTIHFGSGPAPRALDVVGAPLQRGETT